MFATNEFDITGDMLKLLGLHIKGLRYYIPAN